MTGQIDSLFGKTKKIVVAKLLGVSPATVTLLNNGDRKPSSDLILRFRDVLDMPAAEIWSRFHDGGNSDQPTAN